VVSGSNRNVLERESEMNPKDFEVMVVCYWLMFLRAPGRDTLPGECVDLGEIGTAAEKSWSRDTPYSLAEPSR
jgi:hypothetical protein